LLTLEYEKTIQSLENTLAEVRASLSQTESTLLEKESKLAYAESINQQLNARVSKLSQRESQTAEYVRKLETRLDEKDAQAAGASQIETETISELRVENAKLREEGHSSEAYLAVLEENLAEADADIEFWKREVDRLERVVERQRGLRKLDTLLDELDEVQQEALENAKSENLEAVTLDVNHTHTMDHPEGHDTVETADRLGEEEAKVVVPESTDVAPSTNGTATPDDDKENHVPADDGFIRAELSNLRKSHETTVRKLEDLTNTYNSSLECIAELKQQLDDSLHHDVGNTSTDTTIPSTESPSSETKEPPFLESAGVRTLKTAAIADALLAAGPQRSFSRSLSSEHSLAGVSESYKNGTATTNGVDTHVDESDEDVEALKDEMEDLRQKVQGLEELRREHAKLTENYNESMDLLDELKAQLQRPPASPVPPVSPVRPGLIRSRSISDIKNVQNDRATRALDTLSQKIAELEADEEFKQSLNASLSIVTTEIISKSSQCQQQASEITTLRAEVDAKGRLISGLTKAQSRYNRYILV
jgi:chromosome segregation ATPase